MHMSFNGTIIELCFHIAPQGIVQTLSIGQAMRPYLPAHCLGESTKIRAFKIKFEVSPLCLNPSFELIGDSIECNSLKSTSHFCNTTWNLESITLLIRLLYPQRST